MKERKDWTHFIGIGGAGMSGLAKILLELGCKVSGSDLHKSKITERLTHQGALVYEGHHPAHLHPGVDQVVVSSAIPPDNPELVLAMERGIPVLQRAELLAQLMRRQRSVAVAGAHGKTTTTSMISLVLEKNGVDPTVVVGGELNDIGGNAKLGRGEFLVAEADESDGSFLKLHPHIAVVTNIENDHLDHYGSQEKIVTAFAEFLQLVPPVGHAILCYDDPELRKMAATCKCNVITYGLKGGDYQVRDIHPDGMGSRSQVWERGKLLGQLQLAVPGSHNVSNALAAVVVGRLAGLNFPAIASALAVFRGAERRFQAVGEEAGIKVVDDYGHHPTEIAATIKAAREVHPGRIIVVFQPHRYSRTQLLHNQFGPAFAGADVVFVDEIYGAGEKPIPGVTARLIYDVVKERNREVYHLSSWDALLDQLVRVCHPGDMVITMGAGNIWKIGGELLARLGRLGKAGE